ncbi:MAG: hypothetical protein JWN17_1295 [Frankiales bacterium]|nr:hypothetical protein [Frankiales bacterium]
MTYTADKPALPETTEQLKARIPGWGVDLDPADRPSEPKLQWKDDRTGAHWDLPEQQQERRPRERSVEHARLTPVFGTSAPLHGVSGLLRKRAYARYSEGTSAHWLLLMLGDRVDAWGSHLRGFATLHPDPVATGLRTELTHGGLRSRLGRGRNDVSHQLLDPLVVGGPWVLGAALVVTAARRLRRR